MSTEPELYRNGPYLAVALPPILEKLVPVNATAVIREWEEMLSPVRALRTAAATFLQENVEWTVGERFITPGFSTVERLREAARDDDLAELFRQSNGYLGDEDARTIRGLVHESEIQMHFDEAAQPVLLGLAAGAVCFEGIGLLGMQLKRRFREEMRRVMEEDERQWEVERKAKEKADRAQLEDEEEAKRWFYRERGLRLPGESENDMPTSS